MNQLKSVTEKRFHVAYPTKSGTPWTPRGTDGLQKKHISGGRELRFTERSTSLRSSLPVSALRIHVIRPCFRKLLQTFAKETSGKIAVAKFSVVIFIWLTFRFIAPPPEQLAQRWKSFDTYWDLQMIPRQSDVISDHIGSFLQGLLCR